MSRRLSKRWIDDFRQVYGIWPMAGGSDTATGGETPPSDPSGASGAGEQQNGSTDVRDPEGQARSQEAARYRVERNQERERAEQLEKQLQELQQFKQQVEEQGKSELEKLQTKAQQAQAQVQALQDKVQTLTVENAFLRQTEFQFRDLDGAVKLADLSGVTVSEDGTVDTKTLAQVVRTLAEGKPYLLANAVDNAPKDPSGAPVGSHKKEDGGIDQEYLRRTFPALRR